MALEWAFPNQCIVHVLQLIQCLGYLVCVYDREHMVVRTINQETNKQTNLGVQVNLALNCDNRFP